MNLMHFCKRGSDALTQSQSWTIWDQAWFCHQKFCYNCKIMSWFCYQILRFSCLRILTKILRFCSPKSQRTACQKFCLLERDNLALVEKLTHSVDQNSRWSSSMDSADKNEIMHPPLGIWRRWQRKIQLSREAKILVGLYRPSGFCRSFQAG